MWPFDTNEGANVWEGGGYGEQPRGLLSKMGPRQWEQLAAFGQALAQAGAPSQTGNHWGLGLSQGLGAATQAGSAFDLKQLEKQLKEAQLAKGKEDLRKQKTINDFAQSVFGGQGNPMQMGLTLGAAQGDIGPTNTNAARGIAAQQQLDPIARMMQYAPGGAFLEGKYNDAFNMGAKLREGIKQDAGAYYVDPISGQRRYLGDPTKGLNVDQQGRVTTMPGSLESLSALEGAKTRATEQAKQDISLNQPQVYPGFGAGGAPVFATPNELRGQTQGLPPGMSPQLAKALQDAGVGFTADDKGNFKIVPGITPQQSRGMVTGANPVQIAQDKTAAEGMAGGIVKQVADGREKAAASVATIQNVTGLRDLLNSGKIAAGPTANLEIFARQIGDLFNVGGKDNKEILANSRGAIQKLAQQELDAAMQMRGQGQITEAERGIIKRAASGDITLTKVELLALSDALEKVARIKVDSHNAFVSKLGNTPGTAGLADLYRVNAPPSMSVAGGKDPYAGFSVVGRR